MTFRIFTGAARSALIALSAAVVMSATPTYAYDPSSTSDLNVDSNGVMLRGYDPVAYVTEGKAVKGDPQIRLARNGGTYHFSSDGNRERFAADPARYQPQYGGFCAMGVAMGKKLDGDPQLFRTVDGKLYLNVNEAAQRRWTQDIPGFLKSSEQAWPTLLGKSPNTLN